jgi:hypothetical protein
VRIGCVGKPEGDESPGTCATLKWILNEWGRKVVIGFTWLMIKSSGGFS